MSPQKYLSQFSSGNWQGPDADIATSLGDYGLAWCFHSEGEERFHPHEIRFAAIHYYPSGPVLDWGDFDRELDVYKEYDWVKPGDWESILESHGVEKVTFDLAPLEYKIQALVSYYGPEEIFGTPYYGEPIDSATYRVCTENDCQDFETREDAEKHIGSLPPGAVESYERCNWMTGEDEILPLPSGSTVAE